MNHSCAACRRAAAASSSGRGICASCSWLRARKQLASATDEGPASTACASATAEVCEATTNGDLALLFELAPLVGENGSEVVTRVLFQIARGNERAYRAELNRLTARFIAAIERVPS